MKRRQEAQVVLVSGTDTGVGKTVFTAAFIRWLRGQNVPSMALKPLASGDRSDAEALHRAQDGVVPLDVINPWHFQEPLAPLLAARRAGRRVAPEALVEHVRMASRGLAVVVVEAAGGWLSPLMEGMDAPGLARALDAKVVLVAANRLGVIGHLRLAWEAARAGDGRRGNRHEARPQVVLMAPPRPGLAESTNPALLREFIPADDVHEFPWLSGRMLRSHGAGDPAVGSALSTMAGRWSLVG
jgi:dethiobiotin synthetase